MQVNKIISQHRITNNALFSKFAKFYNFEKFLLFPLRKKAASFINTNHSKLILDVATGTGSQALEWARHGHKVVGIDLSSEMLEYAILKKNKDLKLNFLQADAVHLPFKNQSFAVSSIDLALHDMPYEVGILTLKEMKRVTKKRGKIIVVEYLEPEHHWLAKIFFQVAKIYETTKFIPFINLGLKRLLKNADLKISKKFTFLGIAQIVVIKI